MIRRVGRARAQQLRGLCLESFTETHDAIEAARTAAFGERSGDRVLLDVVRQTRRLTMKRGPHVETMQPLEERVQLVILRVEVSRDDQRSRAHQGRGQSTELSLALGPATHVTIARQVQAREDEARWYRELCDRLVRLSDIESLQQDIAILRAEEVAHEDEVKAKMAQTEAAREALSASTNALREATAARNKFEELRRRERDAVAREFERREELELEEVAGNRRDREEEVSFEDV